MTAGSRPAPRRARAGRSRVRLTRAAFVFLGLVASAAAAVQGQTPEYRLKAAVLSKFPQFVDWPPAALPDGEPFRLCVTPSQPFGPFLRELVRGERFRSREVVLREVASASGIDTCQVLFVARQDLANGYLQRAMTRPILTIGDDDRFIAQGGIINLLVVDNAIRFEIDEARARRAGLGVNAQLLRLASKVHRNGP